MNGRHAIDLVRAVTASSVLFIPVSVLFYFWWIFYFNIIIVFEFL